MIRKTTCSKCGSVDINVTWRYNKEQEMGLYMGHDGFGFQFEDADIKCAKCGNQKLLNELYDKKGKIIKEKE
jgi:hypothetical protein